MALDEIGSNLIVLRVSGAEMNRSGYPCQLKGGGCTAQTCMPKHAVFADSHGKAKSENPLVLCSRSAVRLRVGGQGAVFHGRSTVGDCFVGRVDIQPCKRWTAPMPAKGMAA
jgi:hypothetical protein